MTMYVAVLIVCIANQCGFTNSDVLYGSEAACNKAVATLRHNVKDEADIIGLCVPIKMTRV
ncbi:hypothetical protein UFOVP1528_45 [uncultured Caudovirales phage]|uniref:Uncharacterized protein n=1 Tax=uncultured Caudovirales phage TaxID=2100421 RepID=A0A6J5QMH9_9CAUD|nr:hypothetical protein UFOVP1080_18 [uncultured Caudovirales phage]CAB4197218.1 hypothetical protein UFOVP1321_6 [uncultured Caudovirales phage]CAB5227496.1 hypothetical protein UFOVP1528_45 [uncultured Caudovirales phage]